MDALELKLPPLALVVIIAAGMLAVSRIPTNPGFALPGAAWISAAVAAAGAIIAVLGVVEFRRVGTTVDPRVPDQSANLVVSGVYRLSRNPMYLGFLLVLVAWGLFLGSIISLLLIPAFVLSMNYFQIFPEERFMREKFGDSYETYVTKVRRWI